MNNHLILAVDDQPEMLNMVRHGLEQSGYRVLTALNGQSALRQMYEHHPDLIILDVNLSDPKMDGVTVCQRIREVSDVPILMLTAQSEPEDIVRGLDAGADDYLIKPYHADVLQARIRANLRRVAAGDTAFTKDGVIYSDSYLTINLDEHRVIRNGHQVKLSPTEFNLLAKLVRSAPRVVSYRDLLQDVWGFEYVDDIDYLRVYVWHVRRKIEKDPKNPDYIQNELGIGYRFEKQT